MHLLLIQYLYFDFEWNELISPYTHIYTSVYQVSNGSDNGLSPIRRQAIIWTLDS